LIFNYKKEYYIFQIGLMREGVLLSEASPQQLMSSTNCSHLEEAFLKLSKRQNTYLRAEEQKGASE
jgi:hypothetical protein